MRTVTRLMLTRHMLLSSQRAYEQEKKESDDQSLRTSDVRGSLFKVPGMQQRRDCNRKIRGKKKKRERKKKEEKKKIKNTVEARYLYRRATRFDLVDLL